MRVCTSRVKVTQAVQMIKCKAMRSDAELYCFMLMKCVEYEEYGKWHMSERGHVSG